MRTSIWLVRHGQTELNRQRRYQGSSDSPLTTFGRRQSEALRRRLSRIPFTSALVSPCGRTQQTALAILAGRTVPMQSDTHWCETAHGTWEGLSYAEVRERYPHEVTERFSDPLHGRPTGGESLADVAERVWNGWQDLCKTYRHGRILVITHATPVQLILCMLNNMPATTFWHWRIDLGSVTAIDLYEGGPIVRMVNEVPRWR